MQNLGRCIIFDYYRQNAERMVQCPAWKNGRQQFQGQPVLTKWAFTEALQRRSIQQGYSCHNKKESVLDCETVGVNPPKMSKPSGRKLRYSYPVHHRGKCIHWPWANSVDIGATHTSRIWLVHEDKDQYKLYWKFDETSFIMNIGRYISLGKHTVKLWRLRACKFSLSGLWYLLTQRRNLSPFGNRKEWKIVSGYR